MDEPRKKALPRRTKGIGFPGTDSYEGAAEVLDEEGSPTVGGSKVWCENCQTFHQLDGSGEVIEDGPTQPAGVAVPINQLQTILEARQSAASNNRAFGWPTGTVRAILALSGFFALFAGVALGLLVAGTEGAQVAGSILGPPAGAGLGFYFNKRD